MDSLFQDLKLGLKLLAKEKAFTVTAVLTLGLTLGANAAIFTVVHSVLLRPLPVPEPERILLMYNSFPNAGAERGSTSAVNYEERLAEVDAFEEQAMFNFRGRSLGEGPTPERVRGMQVTPSFFRLLRAEPRLGRIFLEEEGVLGNERKVILSHALWQRLFGGDESVIDRDLRVDGQPYRIVGVMPEDFHFLDPDVRLWTSLAFTEEQRQARFSHSWTMIGRLRPGATLELAQEQIDALNARTLESLPQFREMLVNAGFCTRVVRLQDDLVRDIDDKLYLLWGGVFLVLLIGAVNLTNLALVRSTARLKELVTRVALGAGRGRVTRQLLTESLVLAAAGGIAGLACGYGGLKALRALGMEQIPRGTEIAMDGTVVAVCLGLALAVGVVVGVIPIAGLARANASAVLREEGRSGTSGRGAQLLRRVLVTAQVALAFVLLIGAGLLLASFRHIVAIDPGFEPHRLVTAWVSLPGSRYADDDARRAFAERAVREIRALPGVVEAGATSSLPFGGSYSDSVVLAEGYVMAPGESLISPNQIRVTPGYFEAMGIPKLSGRFFDQRDGADAARVVIVDDRLARWFWGDEDPIGRRMFLPSSPEDLLSPGPNAIWLTVVGVVEEVRLRGLVDDDDRFGMYYFPVAQDPSGGLSFAIRAAVEPSSLVAGVRRAVAEIDPELPVFDVQTMEERMAQSLVTRRSPMVLSLAFGGLALFLAAVGLYGVLAYLVARRTKEIGIRMALGSSGRRIFRLVLNEGLVILAAGLAVGLGGAWVLRRALESQLYGVGAGDPFVLGLVVAVLGLVALVACLIPATRATRIDPVVALGE